MGLFGKDKKGKEEEKTERRSLLRTPYMPKKDPIGEVKARLAEFKAETYRDYEPPSYGLKIWWVLGYIGEKEEVSGPYYTASDADRKLVTYDDGEIFELRNIDSKGKAKEAIEDILEKRKELALLQGRMPPPPEVLRRVSRALPEPEPRQKLHRFGEDGVHPEE